MLLTLSFIHRTANAARSDSERRPIGFRTPSDQIPNAVRSDCERNTVAKVHELVLRRAETPATREDIATQYDTKKRRPKTSFFYKFLKRLRHY